jgi:hypothetical protein
MKRFLAFLATGGLLLGLSIASHALSYTVKIVTPTTTVNTTNNNFQETYTPAPDFEYFTPSVVSFGTLDTIPLVPPAADLNGTFPGAGPPLEFKFGQGNGSIGFADGSDDIDVTSTFSGEVGYSSTSVPFSTAKLTATAITVVSGPNAGATGVLDTDPNNGLKALRLDLTYLGTPVQLWFDQISSIPAPGAQDLSISGFVNDHVTPPNVPEPGAMALLLGSGVTGSLLLIRRRRA